MLYSLEYSHRSRVMTCYNLPSDAVDITILFLLAPTRSCWLFTTSTLRVS